jgi:hypothetical protein
VRGADRTSGPAAGGFFVRDDHRRASGVDKDVVVIKDELGNERRLRITQDTKLLGPFKAPGNTTLTTQRWPRDQAARLALEWIKKGNKSCPHGRLKLERTEGGYFTGAYFCLDCGTEVIKPPSPTQT